MLLLEAGRRDRHPLIAIPAGFAKMTTGPFTWGLATEPQRHACNRVIPMAQGKVLGGGSSINAQVFARGHPTDDDRWARDESAPGWSFEEIRPYFLRSEGNEILSGAWHGRDGPLGVSNIPTPHPRSKRFVQACQELGMPYNPDFNRDMQDSTGIYQTTSRNGQRCSTARGYLRPVLHRRNLTVVTQAMVRRVLVENGRAIGVEAGHGNPSHRYRAAREVVVSSGGIGSARLLMLSGIGAADHLRSVGVDVVHNLPGVGEALHDHYVIDGVCQLKNVPTLNRYNQPHWMLWAGLQYLLFRSGPATSNIAEGGAFWRSQPSEPVPDMQYHFLPGVGVEAGVKGIDSGAGCTLNSYFVRPQSRGTVRLRSADPNDKPLVDPNYLSAPGDLQKSTDTVAMSREILRQRAFRDLVEAEVEPGAGCTSRADLEDYVRRNGRTGYYPVGSCRMGNGDMAVVDPDLRVRGVERVARLRQFGHAEHCRLKHQCGDGDDRRKGKRPDEGEQETAIPSVTQGMDDVTEQAPNRVGKDAARATLTDVARAAGVSRSTVSLVLNGSPSIPAETARRVNEAARAVGYVLNRRAAGLRTRRSGLIAIAMNDLENPSFAEVVAGAQAKIERHGDVAILSNSSEDPARQAAFLTQIREYGGDGLLICPAAGATTVLHDAALAVAPHMLMFSRRLNGFAGDFCGSDNAGGMRQVMDHLARAGHLHFAYLGSSQDVSPARDRLGSFRDGLPRNATGFEYHGAPTRAAGYQATLEALDRDARITVIVCYNDTMALGAMLALRARNLVPAEGVSVTGFDNVAEAGLWSPGLISVDVPRRQLGQRAAARRTSRHSLRSWASAARRVQSREAGFRSKFTDRF